MVVSVIIMGGLGNSLFQIFTTIAYCIENNLQFVFPYTNNVGDRSDRPRYWLSFLNPLLKYTTYKNNNFNDNNLFSLKHYNERYFHYVKIPYYDNIILYGYFQSYKYFDNYKNEILKMLLIKEQIEQVKNEYIHYFPISNVTISMHFRLGDYKNKSQYHPILPISYYENSIQHIYNSTKYEQFIINYFCENEDNEYVLNVIYELKQKYQKIIFVKIDDNIPDWKQLLIMSACDHNIIANSSFSYFGAYFNQNKDKIVCYPKIWFGEYYHHYNVNDICEPKWFCV
jgi:hypothetical protein